ncbi:hypothetical protein WJX72_008419 [[Myrmecia] bisecta]|uniref:Uncharacterized protein n=1 Tax=[Myrmecia] bisecta TaxID=41462 RepID=A0AAW1Q1F6_9CHLO
MAERWLQVIHESNKEYANTWRGPQVDQTPEAATAAQAKQQDKEATLLAELAAAARSGGEGLKPYIRHLYQTKASFVQESLKEFIAGYKEGMSKTANGSLGTKAAENTPDNREKGSAKVGMPERT